MDTNQTAFEALQDAIERAGGQSALARICGVAQPTVWKWVQSSKRMPAEYVLRTEVATGVSRHCLRPDIYPVDLPPAPARCSGNDQRAGLRLHGVDLLSGTVSFNQSQDLNGEAA